MKKLIKSLLLYVTQKLLNNRHTSAIVNAIYERASWKGKDFFMRNVQAPTIDLSWYFYLLNDKKIVVPVTTSFPNSWHFATSYFWHDTGLTFAEYHILSFYDKQYAYFDIGSNIGLRSILSASSGRKTILFEPNKTLHPFVNYVYSSNQFNNYSIESLCLSDHIGKQTFYISSSSYMSSLIKDHASEDKIIDEYEVQLTTLDHYVNENKIIPKLIKIDVEGHEMAVLKGATELITAHQPSVIIEILDEPINKNKIFKFFTDNGYTIISIDAYNEPYLVKNFIPTKHYSFNYLFVKDESLLNYLSNKNLMIDLAHK